MVNIKKIKQFIKLKIALAVGVPLLGIVLTVMLYIAIGAGIVFSVVTALNGTGIFDSIVNDKVENAVETIVNKESTLIYGVYPADEKLKIKQEMLEICDKVGQIYGIPGKYLFGIALVECSASNIPNIMAGKSLYKDLCVWNSIALARDGRSMFINGPHTGIHKDEHGNIITDPTRVGRLRPDAGNSNVAAAIGPFQMYSTYIENRVNKMYVEKDSKPSIVEAPMMSYYDEKLGFLRPNPFYFPDAAVAAAELLSANMQAHKNRSDIWSGTEGIPENVRSEILYIYGCDRYHGDTEAKTKGAAAVQFHNAFGRMYARIYEIGKQKGILKTSLSEFWRKNDYSREVLKTAIGGVEFTTNGSLDYDGTYNHRSNIIKSDENGKYVELCGVKLYKPLITEASEGSAENYRELLRSMRPGPAGQNWKYGYIYGLIALNEASYYTDMWLDEIGEATKGKDTVGRDTGGRMVWPVPGFAGITSHFGWRKDPIEPGKIAYHTGIDIGANHGSNIVAAADGVVKSAGWRGAYGLLVIIDHGNGIETYYAHCSQILVNEGDTVKMQSVIAKVGSTGRSTGPHLHFEVRKNGTPVDPKQWVK